MSLKAINVIWKLVNTIEGNIRGTLETSIYNHNDILRAILASVSILDAKMACKIFLVDTYQILRRNGARLIATSDQDAESAERSEQDDRSRRSWPRSAHPRRR